MAEQKVLIVDDNPQNIQLAAAQLKGGDVSLAFARSGAEALAAIAEESFDLLLVDIMMPEMDGFELCTKIKENPGYRDVPLIFLTARDDKESIVRGFGVGAADYIAKPFFGPELAYRVRTHLRLRDALVRLEAINASLNVDLLEALEKEQDLSRTREDLARDNRKLYEQATRDALTGLANRRSMTTVAEYEYDRLVRSKKKLGLILGDIDHFKRVNDTHGHDCGDRVLIKVAEVLVQSTRRQDQVARWGGEEFLILLPDTTARGAAIVAEKIRVAIRQESVTCYAGESPTSIGVTMTFGVAECDARSTPEAPIETALRRADEALYEGKSSGRDRVCIRT